MPHLGVRVEVTSHWYVEHAEFYPLIEATGAIYRFYKYAFRLKLPMVALREMPLQIRVAAYRSYR